ncbi:hypothetical protein HMPREF0063_10041 [Aeromicrobium marinum DSM 15272]|uniref:LtfC/p132/Gp6 beta-sandwich domain-containing protein n=1 Tax=Aeromicrobium marinum DSM 15272 TaxID=585531 RepID=E2S7N4_9ACTN|nr:hypothetical protein [Aeromicrobium marinum]EFQ84700.1 hypothetical protein HMPREF0063_10041 [Aeromicrobium marinum DSM 15272]
MPEVQFGADPLPLKVILTSGADFRQVVQADDGEPWPESLSAELRFSSGQTWAATVDGTDLVWAVDKAQVAVVIAAEPSRVDLFAVDGTSDECWARGVVVICA